jgi:hypothetical protein
VKRSDVARALKRVPAKYIKTKVTEEVVHADGDVVFTLENGRAATPIRFSPVALADVAVRVTLLLASDRILLRIKRFAAGLSQECPSSTPSQCMWYMWEKIWHWYGVFCEYFCFSLSASFRQCSTHIGSSVTEAV